MLLLNDESSIAVNDYFKKELPDITGRMPNLEFGIINKQTSVNLTKTKRPLRGPFVETIYF